jgi:hypothetical protein
MEFLYRAGVAGRAVRTIREAGSPGFPRRDEYGMVVVYFVMK